MSEKHSADVYDSPLDLSNWNDPRTLAVCLIGRDKDVLELGPATGRVTRVLQEHGCRVIALERDPGMAPYLEPYCSRLIIGNIEQLSLKDVLKEQRFQVILAGDFLEHLADPLTLLRQLKDYLSNDGYVVASIPNIAHGSVRLSLLQGKFEYKQIGLLDQTHLRFFTLESILRLFADAGLAVIDVQRVRQDPFEEPYIEGPRLDKKDLPDAVKQQIENDPDAATVQFVVRAVPVDSPAAYAQTLLALESQIQVKQREICSVQDRLLRLQEVVREREQGIAHLKNRLQSLEAQIHRLSDAKRQNTTKYNELENQIRERDNALRELRAANEQLTAWLSKYKNAKERLLPTGSLRDRVARKLAGDRLGSSAGVVKKPADSIAPLSLTEFVPTAEGIVDPPQEWLGEARNPPVVIVIPNWNRLELLRACIESVFSNTAYERYRICIYDQGSTDGSREYLLSLGQKVDPVLAATNIGFVGANNAMIQRYPKWDVVFLNNDTQVKKGWLEALVDAACSAENIGLVGCKLLYSGGSLQEAGSQIFQDGSARAYGKYEDQWDPQFNQVREVDYCSAACLYAKRGLLDAVGGFDERYSPAYYEDSDLAFAARAAGFKVVYQPRSVVVHHEYGTSGNAAAERMGANRQKFVEKWRSSLTKQQRNLWEAVSVGGRDKILVIHDLIPGPDRSSGGRRLYELLRLLARRYHVVLAYLQRHYVREYLKPLEQYGITAFYPGYAQAVHNPNIDLRAILENNEFKYIFCELYTVAEQYGHLVRSCRPDSKLIIDTFDVHFLREMRKAELLRDPNLLEQARETETRELAAYRAADLVLTVTEADRQVLLQKDSGLNVSVVPNIHSMAERVAGRERRRNLLFVGGFSHDPNVDAMRYFCAEILPLVLAELPDMKLHIVGNMPPPEIVALGSDHVLVEGHVPNLAPYLDSALVSIAPLRYGSGMKGKVGEAMAYGLPVVTTTIGAEGMDLTQGLEALVADDPVQFAQCIRRLYEDAELWSLIAKNGRLRVEREWSPGAVEPEISRALDSLAAVAALRSA
ncbi:MAG TPA: glycosyltransferase [Terriglobales bacterium]